MPEHKVGEGVVGQLKRLCSNQMRVEEKKGFPTSLSSKPGKKIKREGKTCFPTVKVGLIGFQSSPLVRGLALRGLLDPLADLQKD